MMVASLDRDELSPWFFKIENEQLKLQVQVAPFQQIFAGNAERIRALEV